MLTASLTRRLPPGYQWIAHDQPGKRAALRRIRQMLSRGVMICANCHTERPLQALQPARRDPTDALMLTSDPTLGVAPCVVCTVCLPPDAGA